jgi:hypothetical protein
MYVGDPFFALIVKVVPSDFPGICISFALFGSSVTRSNLTDPDIVIVPLPVITNLNGLRPVSGPTREKSCVV